MEEELIKLVGTAQGPGWGSIGLLVLAIFRVMVRLGELQGFLKAVRSCPCKGCPFRTEASTFGDFTLTKRD
jgi:hypothetical protein